MRIEKLQKLLPSYGVDYLVVDNPLDLFYLTGVELSAGRLILSQASATLHVDGRYLEACKRALSIAVKGLEYPTFEGKRVGFDAHATSFQAYEKLQELKGEWIALDRPVQKVRAVKESEEIALLREAAALGSQGFDFVCTLLKEGITEEEVALELELFWRRAGGSRLAFAPHVAFGENAAYPHYHVGSRALKRGDLVLIDIGVVRAHYHSDMTRVLFFGEPDPQLAEIYHIVREAQAAALEMCRPGVEAGSVDEAARALITSRGYGEQFVHSLGHGVGLEIHEAPTLRKGSSDRLAEGMVVTIEPGIYLPGLGGVRLEDTVVITESGYENLTCRPILSSLPQLELLH